MQLKIAQSSSAYCRTIPETILTAKGAIRTTLLETQKGIQHGSTETSLSKFIWTFSAFKKRQQGESASTVDTALALKKYFIVSRLRKIHKERF